MQEATSVEGRERRVRDRGGGGKKMDEAELGSTAPVANTGRLASHVCPVTTNTRTPACPRRPVYHDSVLSLVNASTVLDFGVHNYQPNVLPLMSHLRDILVWISSVP